MNCVSRARNAWRVSCDRVFALLFLLLQIFYGTTEYICMPFALGCDACKNKGMNWIEYKFVVAVKIFSVSLAWLFFYNSTHFHRHIYYQLKAIKQDLSIIFYIYSKIRMHYVYMEVMELNRMRLLYFYAVETVGVCKPWSRVPHWFPYKDRKPLYGNYWGTLLQGLHSIHVKGKEQKYIH